MYWRKVQSANGKINHSNKDQILNKDEVKIENNTDR